MSIGRIEQVGVDGRVRVIHDTTVPSEEPTVAPGEKRPTFPEAAWRGIFADYRSAMRRATETSDAYHFAAVWTRCAVALGRRVQFPYGMGLFPNVYVVCFGPTGDRKSTATRRAMELGADFKVVVVEGRGKDSPMNFPKQTQGRVLTICRRAFLDPAARAVGRRNIDSILDAVL